MPNIKSFSFVPMVLGDLEKEVGKLFNDKWETVPTSDWLPSIDVIEDSNNFIIKADVPGVDPKDIKVHMNQNVLTIEGQKESEHKEKKDNYVRYERSKGSFYRRFTLPEMVDAEKINAKSKNGVLEITIPKTNKTISRKIEVEEKD